MKVGDEVVCIMRGYGLTEGDFYIIEDIVSSECFDGICVGVKYNGQPPICCPGCGDLMIHGCDTSKRYHDPSYFAPIQRNRQKQEIVNKITSPVIPDIDKQEKIEPIVKPKELEV